MRTRKSEDGTTVITRSMTQGQGETTKVYK